MMASTYISKLFLLSCLLGVINAQADDLNPCAGITCPKGKVCRESNSCVDRCHSQICPLFLVFDCFCEPGFCQNPRGKCVPENNNP